MDLRLVIVVLGVFLCHVQGFPSSPDSEESSSIEDGKKMIPLEEVKKTPSVKEVRKTTGVEKSLDSLSAKMKARLQEDSSKLQDSKEGQEDTVRSARQSPVNPTMTFGRGPHSTTVCINVRSNQNPEVVCGPPVEDKGSVPPAARYAYPYPKATPFPQYPVRYAQEPSSAPAPARGYPLKRTEEELLKPVDPYNQGPVAPGRGPSPGSVVVHRNYYNSPLFSAGLSPSAALLRLNCALQPDGGQFLSAPMLRSNVMGFYPVAGEQIITLQDGSAAKFGANVVDPPSLRAQNPFALPQAPKLTADEQMYMLNPDMVGAPSPYPFDMDPWAAAMMQGRSAAMGEEPWEQQLMRAAAESPERAYIQQHLLRQTADRLQQLQAQLKSLEQQEMQKVNPEDTPSADPSAPHNTPDTKAPPKPAKRQTKSKS